MADEASELKMGVIPGWAPQIFKQKLRDMRYNALITRGSHDEHLEFVVRRADKEIGLVSIEHWFMTEPREKHDIRVVFKGIDKDHEERFTPHSIAQMEEFCAVLAGRICKYGMSKNRRWCDGCTEETRHKEGLFDPPTGPRVDEI